MKTISDTHLSPSSNSSKYIPASLPQSYQINQFHLLISHKPYTTVEINFMDDRLINKQKFCYLKRK